MIFYYSREYHTLDEMHPLLFNTFRLSLRIAFPDNPGQVEGHNVDEKTVFPASSVTYVLSPSRRSPCPWRRIWNGCFSRLHSETKSAGEAVLNSNRTKWHGSAHFAPIS